MNIKPGETFLHTIYRENLSFSEPLKVDHLLHYLKNSAMINPFENSILKHPKSGSLIAEELSQETIDRFNAILDEFHMGYSITYTPQIPNEKYGIKQTEAHKLLFIVEKETGFSMPVYEASSNRIHFLSILKSLLLIQNHPNIILIDNLSDALHQSTEIKVIDIFKSKFKGSQLIFVSSNPVFLLTKNLEDKAIHFIASSASKGASIRPIGVLKKKIDQPTQQGMDLLKSFPESPLKH
jgi:hypothetical protein